MILLCYGIVHGQTNLLDKVEHDDDAISSQHTKGVEAPQFRPEPGHQAASYYVLARKEMAINDQHVCC